MAMQVHWHEGLFLRPQHFQAMERHASGRLSAERRLAWAYPYGVIEAKLAPDDLENKRVRFDMLRACMPSGIIVDAPASAELHAIDISKAFDTGTGALEVGLGVPLYYSGRANAIEPGGAQGETRLYKVVERDFVDENTGEDPQAIPMRRINAKLVLSTDDTGDLEVLPLMRITQGTGEDAGLPRRDPHYIPPSLVVAGSEVLRDLVRDLANQLEASRSEMVVQLTRAGFDIETIRGVQFQQMLRLRTLNRYAGIMGPLSRAAHGVSPFEVYLELRGVLGELAALHPDMDQFGASDYDHDNLAPVFMDLAERIRGLLKPAAMATWLKVDFVQEGDIYACELTDEHLSGPNEYFLGIKSSDDPRSLGKLVEDADEFKLMVKSMVQNRIRGVRLKEERHPPVQLPSQVGLHYYRLLRSESARMWSMIEQEKTMAITSGGLAGSSVDEMTLYMTVPS